MMASTKINKRLQEQWDRQRMLNRQRDMRMVQVEMHYEQKRESPLFHSVSLGEGVGTSPTVCMTVHSSNSNKSSSPATIFQRPSPTPSPDHMQQIQRHMFSSIFQTIQGATPSPVYTPEPYVAPRPRRVSFYVDTSDDYIQHVPKKARLILGLDEEHKEIDRGPRLANGEYLNLVTPPLMDCDNTPTDI